MDQFISEMGYVDKQMLIKIINGISLDQQTYRMQTRLVIRNSCQALGNPKNSDGSIGSPQFRAIDLKGEGGERQ